MITFSALICCLPTVLFQCDFLHNHTIVEKISTDSVARSLCLLSLESWYSTLLPIISKGKGSPYSITERRVPELIPVLGSQPAGDVSHKPGGRLSVLSYLWRSRYISTTIVCGAASVCPGAGEGHCRGESVRPRPPAADRSFRLTTQNCRSQLIPTKVGRLPLDICSSDTCLPRNHYRGHLFPRTWL